MTKKLSTEENTEPHTPTARASETFYRFSNPDDLCDVFDVPRKHNPYPGDFWPHCPGLPE